MSGSRKNSKTPEKKPSPTWIVLPSKTYPGKVYFYNTVTKRSTWNNPYEVTNGRCPSSSEASSSEEKNLQKKKCESTQTSHLKKRKKKVKKKKTISNSPDRNRNIQINSEIEDYDEQQDQYFDNVYLNEFSSSLYNINSPPSKGDSITSSRTSLSDSDKNLDYNILPDDNKKQIWVNFAASPDDSCAKKSLALSDYNKPSTSRGLRMEKNLENTTKKSNQGCSKSLDDSPETNIVGVTKRKKGRKKEKELKNKNITYKTIKNVSFKINDKTPAQTRLLKFRKQNAEKLKEIAIANPDLITLKKENVNISLKNKGFNNSNLKKLKENDSYGDACFNRTEICDDVQKAGNHSEDDFIEEMDWEPSTEEADVKNINTFREQSDKANEISSDSFYGLNSDHSFIVPTKTYSWFLVLDTNIFVSCLGFVKELRDSKIPGLGYPVIYVPWRVLQELDHLKDSKIDGVGRHLAMNVRKAIAFLNENFKSGHPRICGQSFEDFAKMIDTDVFAPDDEILHTCIQFKKQHEDKKLMLLTNDKNLQSKAIISGVEVYSKESFHKKYSILSAASPIHNNVLESLNNTAIKVDDCLCEINGILKDFLPLFVETEMKVAFENDWVKLAYKKPPWTLEDALQCLLKHWRSVFFLNFSKETHIEAEKLNERLFKRVPASTDDVVEIIRTVERLALCIKRSQKKKMPYTDLIPTVINKLSNLLKTLFNNSLETVITSISPVSSTSDSFLQTQVSQNEVSRTDISKIKDLFKYIWDSLKNFCCTVTNVINTPEAKNDILIQEMKLKLAQILTEVQELIVLVEKIFETNLPDINNSHPLIIHFCNFLIRVCPEMAPDLKNELPEYLSAFFADFEVRTHLSSVLQDFKDFYQDLSQAAEYFNTYFAC